MLSKQNRLSLRTERARLEKEGSTRHSPFFIIVSAPRSPAKRGEEGTRFAILVTKKLAPLSVNRHRLRRLISEVIRLNLNDFPKGKDVMIIPKKAILTTSREQILSDLNKILSSWTCFRIYFDSDC